MACRITSYNVCYTKLLRAHLVPLGKVLIILLMFVGRVGLLTLAFTIVRRARLDAVRYSEENIMIG